MAQPENPVFSAEYDHLRAVLVRAREAAGLTQAALAQRLGRSASHVVLIETGQRRVEVLDLYRILEAIGVDPATVVAELFRQFSRATPAVAAVRMNAA